MYKNGDWDYAFLVAPGIIPFEERLHLIGAAIEMYLRKQKQKKVIRPVTRQLLRQTARAVCLVVLAASSLLVLLKLLKGSVIWLFLLRRI